MTLVASDAIMRFAPRGSTIVNIAFLAYLLAILALPILYLRWGFRMIQSPPSRLDRTLARRWGWRYKALSLAVAVVTCVLLCASLVSDAEKGTSGPHALDSYGKCIYWVVATMTTTGYGDLYTQTTAGRFAAIFTMMVGLVLFAGILGTVVGQYWMLSGKRSDIELGLAEAEVTNLQLLERLDELSERLARIEESSKRGIASRGHSIAWFRKRSARSRLRDLR